MTDPVVAQSSPYAVDVEEGKKYAWCSCGKSQKQPFCDGTHKDTDFSPLVTTAEKTETVYFCGCKHTKAAPFCDGSHSKL